jgi:hypothetical protein
MTCIKARSETAKDMNGSAAETAASLTDTSVIQPADDQLQKAERHDLLVLVPAATVKFNEKGRDATKLMKDETVAMRMSC